MFKSPLDDYPMDAAETVNNDDPPNLPNHFNPRTPPSVPPSAPSSSPPPWFTAFPQPRPVTPSPQIASFISSTPLVSNGNGHVSNARTSMPSSDLPWARPEPIADPPERSQGDPTPVPHIQQPPKQITMPPSHSRPLLPGQRHALYWIDPAAPRVVTPQDEPSSEDMQWSPPATHDTLPEQSSPDLYSQPCPRCSPISETPVRQTTNPTNLSPSSPHTPDNSDSSLGDLPSSVESPEWLTAYHAKKLRPQLLLFSKGPLALAINGGVAIHPAHYLKGSAVHSNYGPNRQRSWDTAVSPTPKVVVVPPPSSSRYHHEYCPGPYGF